jgi:hypothetical protein
MTFEIIDGGNNKSPKQTKSTLVSKSEQLKIFVSHMRTLEMSIASVKTMALKIEWDELDKRLTACHDQIMDTLKYVKKSSKDKKILIDDMDKPPSRKHLNLIINKDKD